MVRTQQTNRERRLARQANARSRTSTVESVGARSTVESVGAPDPPGDRCAIQIEDYDSLNVSPENFSTCIPIESFRRLDPY